MPPRRHKNKEYYAVVKGRIKEPTIFSSWGDAHPQVTGCSSVLKSFSTIEEARTYRKENGAVGCKEIRKDGAGKTTPLNGKGFHAVANGVNPGIYRFHQGKDGSEEEVNEQSGACHKRFRTRSQAEAFIEDWQESFAEVWRDLIRVALDNGFRPRNMELSIDNVLYKPGRGMEDGAISGLTKRKLNLED